MQYFGYAGKILFVDLTTRNHKTEPLDLDDAKKLIGGSGINQKLTYQHLMPGTPPLSPDNPIVIGAGPLIGTLVPGAGKVQLTTKSAAAANAEGTKFFVGTASGGSNVFGLMLKNAGYDHLVIEGKSDRPCYLRITDDEVEICDAGELWGGPDIYEVMDRLTKRHGKCGVWAIGRAGENLVKFAHGVVDKKSSLGRNGGATVAGSKNLKAIVVKGSKGLNIWDKRELLRLARQVAPRSKEHREYFWEALNYSWTIGKKWAKYYPIELVEETLVEKWACTACPLACRAVLEVQDGPLKGSLHRTTQPMYTPVFGRRLEMKDYREALTLAGMINALGLDYTTTMGMLRFVTRLYERGVISKSDTDGLELRMGDFNCYRSLIEKIANREGIGNFMAEGWFELSSHVGVNAWEDADGDSIEKGSSTMFDGRFTSLDPTRFTICVNPKGAQHYHPLTYVPGHTMEQVREWWLKQGIPEEYLNEMFRGREFNTGRLTKHLADQESVLFCLGVCTMELVHHVLTIPDLANYYTAVTGIETTTEELRRGGERAWTLAKLLNVREGFGREDDRLPKLWEQLIDHPIETKSRGAIMLRQEYGTPVTRETVKNMFDDYYNECGWDIEKGIPIKKKLQRLGLGEFEDALP
jgi:aldehyde:ferredoxin oxidoreductase